MIIIDIICSLIFVVLALGSIWWARVIFNDGFAPLGLYLGATFFSLALWHLKLVSLIQISELVYFIILLSVVGFIFGVALAAPGKFFCISKSVEIHRSIVKGKYLKSFFYVIGVLSTIGWLVLLVLFVRDYSLAVVWEKPFLLQEGFQSRRYIGFLNVLGILVLPTYVMLVHTERWTGWLPVVLVVSALTGLLLAGIKSYIVFSVIVAFFVWGNFRWGGVRLRYMTIVVICFIAFMILYNQIVDIFVPQSGAEGVLATVAPGLYRPYIYMVGSWSALTVLVENPFPQPVWAYQTLFVVWKVLGKGLGLIDPVSEYDPFVDIADIGTQSFNVYSMAGALYWDFGLIGVLLGSAFWGFVSTRVYEKARKSRDWAWILASSIISYGLFLSFFLYYFRFNLFFLLAVVLLSIVLRTVVSIFCRSGVSTINGLYYKLSVGQKPEVPEV